MTDINADTLGSMHALVDEQLSPKTIEARRGAVVALRNGYNLVSLKDHVHDALPERARGTSRHDTLDSLIQHALRHKSPESVAYCALSGKPAITVVYNAQPGEQSAPASQRGAWRDHVATYAFPFSPQWARWTNAAAKSHSVAEFAQLLEDGIGDVRAPDDASPRLPGVTYATPAELLTLASGLQVYVEQVVVDQRTLSNGTKTLQFAERHADEKGEPLKVPTGFLLGIPVFLGGPAYAIPVRLRYRVTNGQVSWSFAVHDADTAQRDAITEAAAKFAKATELPVFYGAPEQ